MHKSKTMYKKIILLSLVSLIVLLNLSFGKKKTKKDKLTAIAKEYKKYTQYFSLSYKFKEDTLFRDKKAPKMAKDPASFDTSKLKWTIALCMLPPKPPKPMPFHRVQIDKVETHLMSEANPVQSPHGNKLYQLFIRNYAAYTNAKSKNQTVGQVIVKEVWNVQAIQHDTSKHSLSQIQSSNDGKWYTPTTVSQLFIMYKEKQDSTNDKGWVYGIVDIEDNKPKPVVLFEGKISTCMSCHANTKYDRMFGLK
jgi:hypothetical protein